MAGWHRQFNVSGTVECGERLETWFQILRDVLQIDDVPFISHMTGEITIIVYAPVADLVSSGWNVQRVHAVVHGEPLLWSQFVATLESALKSAEINGVFHVHDLVEVLP